MCSGRFFAKQEIFIAAAFFLTGFDIEVVGWERHEPGWPDEPKRKGWKESIAEVARMGRPDRRARVDDKYQSGGMMPPDRELRVKMKRKNWKGGSI